MENLAFTEKRTYPRFNVSIPLSCFDLNSDKKINAQSHDISTEGLGIIVVKPIPVGAELDICIHMLDNGEKIYRKGKVVWSNEIDSGSYRIGIRLEEQKLDPVPLVLRTIMAQKDYY